MTADCFDLFCGAGGASSGIAALGLDVFGVDSDTDSIRTHRLAGHGSLQADLATLDLASLPEAAAPLWWISAPCTAFSQAGSQKGVALASSMVHAVQTGDLRWGREDHNPPVWLSLAALEAVLAHRPTYMIWENVLPIRPLFEAIAGVLRPLGYRTGLWAMSSEQWGVAQTRQRLFLAARLEDGDAPLAPPRPVANPYVHPRYVKRRAKVEAAGKAAGLHPWVSMAEALGWTDPALVGFPRVADTDDVIHLNGTDYRRRDLTPSTEPANTLTEKARSWNVYTERSGPGDHWCLRGTAMANATVRSVTEPAMTLGFGNSINDSEAWMWERPATTLVGDQRLFRPGGHLANDGRDNSAMVGRSEGTYKMTVHEAARLQAFPNGHPFDQTGASRTSQFRQVGNAVPPPVALATVGEVLGIEWVPALDHYLTQLYERPPYS